MPQTLLISSLSTDFQQACLPNNRDRNDKLKDTFEAKFNSPDSKLHWITVELIDKSIRNTKLGKAAGFDGIEAEHLRCAHPKMCYVVFAIQCNDNSWCGSFHVWSWHHCNFT